MTDRGLHQGLSRGERLRKRSEFLRTQERGCRRSGRYLVVYAVCDRSAAGPGRTRLGITVSRKVGEAVVRNRVKRWVREGYRRLTPRPAAGTDVVVIAKPSAADSSYQAIESELRRLLASIEDA